MSASRVNPLKLGSNGENTSAATDPNPSRAESISCGRFTMSRNACRTLTSLNGAWSTRIVNGVIAPVLEAMVFTALFEASSFI